MVIGMGGCDNVEWGGIDFAVVPPPPHAADSADAVPERTLPDGPILFYVHRDTTAATVIPVGQIAPDGITRIAPGDAFEEFGPRFMDAFLAPGTELTLFRRGRRAGTLTVDSAAMPTGPVCRPLPRATGTVDLAGADDAVEFLALDTSHAPESRPEDALEPVRSMEVMGDMMAGEMLRARGVAVPNAAGVRRQIQPFPLTGRPEPGFTATYLVDDSLGLGGDDAGAALFVVFTPRGQTGYDTAFVGFADYAATGKAAPRAIDFLDWNGDGNVELLLEVFGTGTSWFRAVGLADGRWRAIFQDRCDPRTAPVAQDTATATGAGRPAAPGTGAEQPTAGQPTPTAGRPTPTRQEATQPGPTLDSIPTIEPTIQLSNPGGTPRIRRDTTRRDTVPPDTGGVTRRP